MKTLSIILSFVICGTLIGAESTEYNKSVTALLGGISQLKTAESTIKQNEIKTIGEYLHKITMIKELEEKIRGLILDNDMKEAQQFYAKRKLYRENKVIRRVTPEQLQSLADDKPARLASFIQTNSNLPWPSIFENDPFLQPKHQIDKLFAERSLYNSGIGSENYSQIQHHIDIMKSLLKDEVDNIKPMEYIVYKKFLDSVNYESQEVYNNLKDLVASK